MKGSNCTYRPAVGEICLISPEHCDNSDGYVFKEFEVVWKDEIRVLYRVSGFWPNLSKWDHIISKPLEGSPTINGGGNIKVSRDEILYKDENGHFFRECDILWEDELFVFYKIPGIKAGDYNLCHWEDIIYGSSILPLGMETLEQK